MRRHGVWDADRVQAALNVLGGAAFVAGSVLFLLPAGFAPGIALFILGSLAMFVGSVLAWRARYGAPRRAATDATVYAAADAAADAAELPGSAATTSSDAPAVGAWPLIAGELPSAPEAPASAPLPGPVRGTARAGFRAPVRMPWGRALRRR